MPAGRAGHLDGVTEAYLHVRSSPNTSFGSAYTKLSYETLYAGGWHVGECNSRRSRVQNRSWCGVV
ncbi:hypothetical protein HaLaN_27250 [Haematococcus lacustris]|uniref:Uncharacterized protein n=1 Tax=Haematococcus lacustris TaxID=44745 RepID=A0A6A0A859_HAELA|nr:hypothetical protein HaLaN_27250 [Haematococcus lacustris]